MTSKKRFKRALRTVLAVIGIFLLVAYFKAPNAKFKPVESILKQSLSSSYRKNNKKLSKSDLKAKITASSSPANEKIKEASDLKATPQEVPNDKSYVVVNDNIPLFTNQEITTTESFQHYGDLDHLNRVTEADANLGVDLMPADKRGPIDSIKPTGWKQKKYKTIENNGWLYNRCHLIGYQLTGQNANAKNLMTGTRWFNVEGMLPFENFVADYIERTENHVRYRITPVFVNDELLARGIYMEGFSVEDNGKGVQFCIYVPNRQPGINLNYKDGSSQKA